MVVWRSLIPAGALDPIGNANTRTDKHKGHHESPRTCFKDFRYSDTAHLSRSDEVLKLKFFKKDATLMLSNSKQIKKGMACRSRSWQVHCWKVTKMAMEVCAWLLYSRCSRSQCQIQVQGTSSIQEVNDHYNIYTKESQEYVRAGKDFSGRITPLFDTMMVQPVKEMGEDLDHPTDSTLIPIIDQPSSSSQPKKDKPSKKAQRQEAEVPQDKVLDLQKAKDAQAKEIAALKKRIQRLEMRKISRPVGLKRLRKVGMSQRVESSKDQGSLGVPEDASKQGRSIADIDVDIEMPVEAKIKAESNSEFQNIQAKLDAELLEEQKLARKQEEEANIALIESWENTQAMMEADRLLAERL
ncbi:hypothetical protein Tco_0078038 [Tanacetum coccineum]